MYLWSIGVEMSAKKVYCKDCKHYSWYLSIDNFNKICGFEKKKNYFGQKVGVPCIQKNYDFNCKDYQKKWYRLR